MVGTAQCTFRVAVGDKISYLRCSGYLWNNIVSPELSLVLYRKIVCWGGSWRRSCLLWKDKRYLYSSYSLFDHLSGRWLQWMLASFHACGTEPTSQTVVISWCSLLNRSSPPWFRTSSGIPPPPGVLPSFRLAIAPPISSIVGISSRLVLVLCCSKLSRASWSMSPGTLSA